MTAPFLQSIDWSRPWLAPLQAAAQPVLAAADWRAALNDAARMQGLCNHRGFPLQFVPQEALPQGVAYEEFISSTGGIPTRENLHDFFNAMVWLTFPAIKKQLNALQAAEIARRSVPANPEKAQQAGTRGKVRDAATIFDENAALLICADMAWVSALRAHRWRETLLEQRQAFGKSVEVILFGHALMEKLVMPYKAITAHTWVVPAEPEFFSLSREQQRAWIDIAVSRQLENGLQTGNFTPLPVLGVPHWWDDQNEAFYTDAQVFRPPRRTI
ncbi:DUF3025 family protein [Paucimonas lemoignei]|uniref:DUF3025 family protein n=1 Tax=Paucimonas lemoignei TaxID=29443 RepID=A0A4R3HQ50_PAULE|nr:DUF3025 domain-containing protein [Paucimonas lemoignei]TCS33539.1 DUF3025 family protein [Paucimonas lemoignei]